MDSIEDSILSYYIKENDSLREKVKSLEEQIKRLKKQIEETKTR